MASPPSGEELPGQRKLRRKSEPHEEDRMSTKRQSALETARMIATGLGIVVCYVGIVVTLMYPVLNASNPVV